jgi:hypothetical protein
LWDRPLRCTASTLTIVVVVNAKGFGSSGHCISCLGYGVFCEKTRGIQWVGSSGHCINCLGYLAFSEKYVGYDVFGGLVIVSTA